MQTIVMQGTGGPGMVSYIEAALTLAKGLGTNTILLKDIGREMF